MWPARKRCCRRITGLALALLLVAPLMLTGHTHLHRNATAPCAACTVTVHAPLVVARVALLPALVLFQVAAPLAQSVPVAPAECPPTGGRAPPASASRPVA
jgi:hypothetical protein